MKILIVGDWRWPQYEHGFARGLKQNGMEIIKLSTKDYFVGIFKLWQKAFPFPGPAMLFFNKAIIDIAKKNRPTIVLFWRPTHVLPSTIRKLESIQIFTISYNNDDPFNPILKGKIPIHVRWLWHYYLKCIPSFSMNFFYRKINCVEAINYGAKHADILLPYFLPWQDRPLFLNEVDFKRFECDVVYVGHFEDDGRLSAILNLINIGFKVRIWSGDDWTKYIDKENFKLFGEIKVALGDEYTKALCGAKICLCFLSKQNRDTYTRRCFEILACGKVMLAERTEDLLQMFREDEEACYFSSIEELVMKVKWLYDNPTIRDRISAAGLRRVWVDKHDVINRSKVFIENVSNKLVIK